MYVSYEKKGEGIYVICSLVHQRGRWKSVKVEVWTFLDNKYRVYTFLRLFDRIPRGRIYERESHSRDKNSISFLTTQQEEGNEKGKKWCNKHKCYFTSVISVDINYPGHPYLRL